MLSQSSCSWRAMENEKTKAPAPSKGLLQSEELYRVSLPHFSFVILLSSGIYSTAFFLFQRVELHALALGAVYIGD